MAKFCLLAELILPSFLLKKMKIHEERVVCLHGMCKKNAKPSSWGSAFTFWKKTENTPNLCEEKKLGSNLKIVQEYLEKRFIVDYLESNLCPI